MKKIIIVDDMSDVFELILQAIESNGAKSEVIITDARPSIPRDVLMSVVGRTAHGHLVILGHEDKFALSIESIGEELRKKAETVVHALICDMPTLDLGDPMDFVAMKKPSPKFPRPPKLPAKFRGKNCQYARRRR